QMSRTADMVNEQTLRALEVQEAVLAALEARVEGMSWWDIARDPDVQRFARRLVAVTPTVETLGLVDPSGHIAVASEVAGTPPQTDLSDRDFVRAFPAGTQETHSFVSGVVASRVDGRLQVHVARPHIDPDGLADGGITTSAFAPGSFEGFFQ